MDTGDEKYTFSWAGRKDTFENIQTTSKGTLIPDKSESVNFDDTENLFIEGDNLEVLKLLHKSLFQKVKIIYIDPPYNIGSDFIYKDDFKKGVNNYLEQTNQSKDGITLTTNPETSGRFHSDWISFMYARLFVAKNLLSDDGVIFVSIGDNEVHNLKFIMNDIFGEENLISEVIWHSKYTTSNDKKLISTQHEYVMIYAKNIHRANFNLLPRTEKADKDYKNPDNDPRGKWKPTPIHAKSGKNNIKYNFTNIRKFDGKKIPSFVWSAPKGRYPRYSKETLGRLEADNRISCGINGTGVPNSKTFLNEVQQGMVSGSLWKYEDVGHTHGANEELSDLIGKGVFDNPKPVKLIKRILQLSTNSKGNDIVLDFFAGSGTTAHSVLGLNKEDGGNRKFICVQIPETIEDELENKPTIDFLKELKKPMNISEICKERIRRVIKNLDSNQGFKVFKLAKSNYNIWENYDGKDQKKLKEQMKIFATPLIEKYKDIDVIYECIIKEGYNLNSKLEKLTIKPNTIYKISNDDKIFYLTLDKIIKLDSVEELELGKNQTLFCLDSSLDDSMKMNLSKQCTLKTI